MICLGLNLSQAHFLWLIHFSMNTNIQNSWPHWQFFTDKSFHGKQLTSLNVTPILSAESVQILFPSAPPLLVWINRLFLTPSPFWIFCVQIWKCHWLQSNVCCISRKSNLQISLLHPPLTLSFDLFIFKSLLQFAVCKSAPTHCYSCFQMFSVLVASPVLESFCQFHNEKVLLLFLRVEHWDS